MLSNNKYKYTFCKIFLKNALLIKFSFPMLAEYCIMDIDDLALKDYAEAK